MRNPLPILVLPLLALPLGCRRGIQVPDFGGLYSRAAEFEGPTRNPVVVIPGILGSTLRQHGTERVVWGTFSGSYANPSHSDGAQLVAHPMRVGAPLHELVDDVYASGALDRVRLSIFGLPIEAAAYAQILGTLGVGGFRDEGLSDAGAVDYGDEHFTCFQFPYDWRRDLSETSADLDAFLREKAAYVREQYRKRYGIDRKEIRFDVVAHSMGGLLLRYYLRFGAEALPADGSIPSVTWAGTDLVDKAVLVGTPSAGSVFVARELVHGKGITWLQPRYPAAMLGTMPALYQLLPRPRHGAYVRAQDPEARVESIMDPAVWEELEWGLADPDQDRVLARMLPDAASPEERRAIALDHLSKSLARASQFHAAMDQPAPPRPRGGLYLVAGDSIPTPSKVSIDFEKRRLELVEDQPGDGTVLRTSTVLDERVGGDWEPQLRTPIDWDRVLYLFDDHLGLTRNPAFVDNVLYWLLEEPRLAQRSVQ